MFFRCRVTVIVAVFLGNVGGEDYLRLSDNQEDSRNVFRDIPTLFQLIVDMLHERPEVLEKDDITTFLEAPGTNDLSALTSILDPENDLSIAKRDTDSFDDEISVPEADSEYNWFPHKADDFEEINSVIPGVSQLTSDEVEEMMLMVDRKLEEYYNETK